MTKIMNNRITKNNKHLNTIKYIENVKLLGLKNTLNELDLKKYENKQINKKIDYILTGMNFKIEENVFKKVFVGFGLIVNRILNKIKGK
tara:strand:+ start:55 stop:321 length:267 start_codon:yes stop_codon:yes gene_type:complete